MISQNSNFGQVQNFMGEEDMIDQSFDQINQEISKALLEMKEEEKDPFKNESILNDNILANKPEIKNKVENQNNICFPNLFNNYNDYKSNYINYYNGNINPKNQMLGYNNNMNNKINQNMISTNINNNDKNTKNMKANNYPINNYILTTPIYNINIINCNKDKNNKKNLKNKNKNKNNQQGNTNSFVSYRGVPGLFNSDFYKNIINLENILQIKDNRTTLIIRNIPNKFDISLLLKELNKNFENKFDVIYLPFDVKNNSNLGFGFINFVNPIHILLFFEEFMGKKWNFSNSQKRCCLAYSNYQGKKDLVEYVFKKLGIKDLTNNNINEKIKKSFFINNMKNLKALIEIPLKYFTYFTKYHPSCLCRKKDDKVFIFEI